MNRLEQYGRHLPSHRPRTTGQDRQSNARQRIAPGPLDGLPQAEKRALQQASVVGTVFWDQALASIGAPSVELPPALVQRELALPRTDAAIVPKPYRWIAGVEGAKGRSLVLIDTTRRINGNHHCVADLIEVEGDFSREYDEAQAALELFFASIFDKCGLVR